MSTDEYAALSDAALSILPSILEAIGKTPMVRINQIGKKAKLECEIVAKCEFFNAGGSVKDRIGKQMVEDAEASGRIRPGDTLIEPTSGNTGIGLALAAAMKGYRCIVTLPEKMSEEKVNILKALGAEIIRTPTEAAWDSPESHIGIARRLQLELPRSHILDQYANPSNPLAHYNNTAMEILEQCDGKIDMIVIGVGTGGTISGIGRKLKEHLPNLIVVGVDPQGSILAEPESLNIEHRLEPYRVEGIGYDFIPPVLDRHIVDTWIKTSDKESFIMARRLIREEGLLCGGSSGAAMVAAIRAASVLKKGQRCVVVLPDSTRNYMSKFLSDTWMQEHEFVQSAVHTSDNYLKYRKKDKPWWALKKVSDLELAQPCVVRASTTINDAIELMELKGFDQLPVLNENMDIPIGVVTIGNILSHLSNGRVNRSNTVDRVMFKKFSHVTADTSLEELAAIFDRDHFTVVKTERAVLTGQIIGLLTRIDLLNYITSNEE